MITLISYFESFGGRSKNNSRIAAFSFQSKIRNQSSGVLIGLPVVVGKAEDKIISNIKKYNPDKVIMFGESADIHSSVFEKKAFNLDDFTIPDNEGNQPRNKKIKEDGLDYYNTSLELPFKMNLSFHCGSFLCNHVYYCVLHEFRHTKQIGFFHVPTGG